MRIDFYGLFSSEMGIGEAARRLLSDLIENNYEVSTIDLKIGHSRKEASFPKTHLETSQTIAIFAINPDALPLAYLAFGQKLRNYSTAIAFWSWELEVVPKIWKTASKLFDEVWTVSDYSKRALEKNSFVPVRAIRLPLRAPDKKFKSFSTNEKYTFLTSFDFQSDVNRKNPVGAISAYRQAISPDQGARLLVKTINSSKHPKEAFELRKHAGDRDDIIFIDQYLDDDQNQTLIMNSDCYLSLHRAEGLGLNLLDAATYGVPIISTGYSAPIEYLKGPSIMFVDYKKVAINFYAGHKLKADWADPNIDHASELISRQFQAPSLSPNDKKKMRESFISEYMAMRNSKHIASLERIEMRSHDKKKSLKLYGTRSLAVFAISVSLVVTSIRRRIQR